MRRFTALSAPTRRSRPRSSASALCARARLPAEAVEATVRRTENHQGHRSLDYTLGILRRWDESGVHALSEITALEPESRSTWRRAVGQTEAQPTDSGTLRGLGAGMARTEKGNQTQNERRKRMAYDKKLLAAARRKLERDREAHEDAMEARRRDVYAKEPRIRAIDP